MKRLLLVLHKDLEKAVGRNEKIKSRIDFLRSNGWFIDYYLMKPKKKYLWPFYSIYSIITTLFMIRQWVREGDDVFILTMSLPPHTHFAGLFLKSFCMKSFWVAELRDALMEKPFFLRHSLMGKLLCLIEKPLVRFADKIIIIDGSQVSMDYLIQTYPNQSGKFDALPYMGFDHALFKKISPRNFDKFTITYAGTLYEDWINPRYFLIAFSRFVLEYGLSPDDLQVNFYVRGWRNVYDELISELDIGEYIHVHDFVKGDEVIAILKGSDILLYINGSAKTREDMLHSKFYDYLGSRSPLLVLAGKNYHVSRIVEDYSLGLVSSEDNIAEISNALKIMFDKKVSINRNNQVEELFDRKKHDSYFSSVLENLVLTQDSPKF